MHILLESRPFYPSVGGMETVGRQLAVAWQAAGHAVQVVTQTPLGDAEPLRQLAVTRRPGAATWWRLLRACDIFVQSGISLKSLPLALLARRPIVFVHHNMLPLRRDTVGVRNALKRAATHLGPNIAVSHSVARDLPSGRTEVIYNPFSPSFGALDVRASSGEAASFGGKLANEERDGVLFVGRLVSVKGVDVALRALALLKASGRAVRLRICGDGPARADLEAQAYALGLDALVTFEGWVSHDEVGRYARRAAVQVVPSRYEPFGIVALEALASRCAVVASRVGGLPEAVGPCGVLVPPDDPDALAHGLADALDRREDLLAQREQHLARFDLDRIAQAYLDVFARALRA